MIQGLNKSVNFIICIEMHVGMNPLTHSFTTFVFGGNLVPA